jgi:hypothetical protein
MVDYEQNLPHQPRMSITGVWLCQEKNERFLDFLNFLNPDNTTIEHPQFGLASFDETVYAGDQ